MDFGMPSIIELLETEECAKLCKKLSLQFIELNLNLPQYQPEQIQVEQMRKIAKQYGIYYTLHMDESCNPCDFNRLVAAAYRQTALNTIELAKQLEAPIINMHLSDGVYFKQPYAKTYLFHEYPAQYHQNLAEFRTLCEQAIGDSGVLICIENTEGYLEFQKHALDFLLQSPVFALTFDIGHSHESQNKDELVLLDYPEKICHFHVHDAIGKQSHLTLGSGEIALMRYFEMAHQAGARVVLETKSINSLKKSTQWVETRLCDELLRD